MLLVDIRLLIILYLQNQPHSHREKDRQTYLSDVYHLVFGQFQHSDVQRWLQWTCVLFSRHQGQFTCAISCQCHVRTTIPEVFKLLLCSFYFSSRTCLVPAYLCVLEFYGDRDLILIYKKTHIFRHLLEIFFPSAALFLGLNWACVHWYNVVFPGGMCKKQFP